MRIVPSDSKGWLRAVFIVTWVWLFSVHIVFVGFLAPFPAWMDYLSLGCMAAILAVVVIGLALDWRHGLGLLVAASIGFAALVGFSHLPID